MPVMTMATQGKSTSLFDDIFKLQNAAPELEIDPEEPEDGFKSGLVQGFEEAESLGPSTLRKQTAIIPDDPKYKGKKTSRRALYSDDDEDQDIEKSDEDNTEEEDESDGQTRKTDEDEDSEEDDMDMEEGTDEGSREEEGTSEEETHTGAEKKEDAVIMTPSASDDREKGKAVSHQLAVWDDLIKCRISLQKVVSSCNRLPNCGTWDSFSANEDFHHLAANVHSSVRKVLSTLLDLQDLLHVKNTQRKISSSHSAGDSDEEITSESEPEETDRETETVTHAEDNKKDVQNKEEEEKESEEDDKSEDDEDLSGETKLGGRKRQYLKRKLDAENVEHILSKRHQEFQTYRNDTLAKWDERTRLSHAKIKSKNFAAFDMSVLKQIQQVLANRGRLIRRIHQNRSCHHILGQPEREESSQIVQETVEDDDDEVEMRQKAKQELPVNYEIIDDSDFYHICLRDLIELKQNEETDPVLANKHWLEIQKLRNKHKRKVDTRASKGRKIRYNIKEKLKNYMAPYDKSYWSEEQRDDLFKALFGGKCEQENGDSLNTDMKEPMTINIGL